MTMTSCTCCAASASGRKDDQDGTSALAIHVPGLVSVPAHLPDVDPAPPHRDRTGGRLDPARLVAGCRRGRGRDLCGRACVPVIAGGRVASVSVVGGVFLPFVQPHSSHPLGSLLPLLH